jgi:ABC-type multidrug transport system fused ATPase/permease subunit
MARKVKKIFGLDWHLTRRLLVYIKKYIGLLLGGLFFLLLSDFLNVYYPYLFKVGIDEHVMKGDIPGLQKITVFLGIVFLGMFVAQYLFNYLVQYLGQKLLFVLRMDLFDKVLSLSNDFYDKTPTGRVLTNLTNDVEAIREFISNGIVTILGDLLKIGFIIGAMFIIDSTLAMISFITIPLFILATFLFRKSIRSGFRQVRKANAEINTEFVESINGIREIRLFNYRDKARQNFDGKNKKYLHAYLKIVRSYALYFPTIEMVSNISMILILFSVHYFQSVQLQVGVIFSFFTYLNMFFRPLRELAEKFNMFQSAMAAAERIFSLLDEPVTVRNPENGMKISGFKGDIVFDHITFSYDSRKKVLDDIYFHIAPREKVAFVGRTGSGKSTIIKLMARLYDVTSGEIRIDGKDIREYDLFDLRREIAIIPQEPMIFAGSVLENIRLHNVQISRDEVIEAAKSVHAHEFILRLPQGYDTPLLEGGKMISTGQKQLISLARAFLKNPSIVILDEATANIDSETEKLLEEGLKELMKEKTTIIIAHRLSTIQYVDRIFVFKEGKIVEQGSHQELLEMGNVYYRLYQTQTILQEL